MENVIGLGAATTENYWSGMRVRQQFLENFTNEPSKYVGKTSNEIRQSSTDDRAIFWGKGHTLELDPNDDFAQGIASPKWNNNYSTGGTPHDTYDVDIDFYLFRAAEAYLNAAEAEMHVNGESSAKAKQYINALRTRAHATTKESYTLQDVLAERSRELYLEGLRRPDLIRYNQFGGSQATYIWDYKGGFPNGGNFDKTRNLFPLPSSEISANPNLTQIDGYSD